MHFSKSIILAFISAVSAANHDIIVGLNGAIVFSPQTVTAAVGDTVTYTFQSQNHTVTSGNPNVGCSPDGTFNSGFIPVPAPPTKRGAVVRGANNIFEERQSSLPQFVVKVTSTQPQVFYCAQAQHCQIGMVGVINPTTSGPTFLNNYQQLSATAKTNQLPNTAPGTGGTLNAAAKAVAQN